MDRKKLNEMWKKAVKELRDEKKKTEKEEELTGRCNKCKGSGFRLRVENGCIIRTCKECGDKQNVG